MVAVNQFVLIPYLEKFNLNKFDEEDVELALEKLRIFYF